MQLDYRYSRTKLNSLSVTIVVELQNIHEFKRDFSIFTQLEQESKYFYESENLQIRYEN